MSTTVEADDLAQWPASVIVHCHSELASESGFLRVDGRLQVPEGGEILEITNPLSPSSK